ncbi:unnamed protein product [Polarella glacialis]|uniref:Uncharacterized protein n=1 Tax=Polarella glacialis TaxID=89957 RepID=A0A813LZT7_POLGL|nr:unnamed protein product [Polarella glacialis]
MLPIDIGNWRSTGTELGRTSICQVSDKEDRRTTSLETTGVKQLLVLSKTAAGIDERRHVRPELQNEIEMHDRDVLSCFYAGWPIHASHVGWQVVLLLVDTVKMADTGWRALILMDCQGSRFFWQERHKDYGHLVPLVIRQMATSFTFDVNVSLGIALLEKMNVLCNPCWLHDVRVEAWHGW